MSEGLEGYRLAISKVLFDWFSNKGRISEQEYLYIIHHAQREAVRDVVQSICNAGYAVIPQDEYYKLLHKKPLCTRQHTDNELFIEGPQP